MPFSKSNLPSDSQQWGREVEAKLTELERAAKLARNDQTVNAAIIKANYETTGVTQKALEETLTYLRGLSFRYATFQSNATWTNVGVNPTELPIANTSFFMYLEKRPKKASAFITVTCDVDLSCRDIVANSGMQQTITQYIEIQSYTGNPGSGAHTTTNVANGQYKEYILNSSTTRSGIQSSAESVSLLGGSNITTTAGVYLNPAFSYRIRSYLTRQTSVGSSTVKYSGNISPQSMTIQITP